MPRRPKNKQPAAQPEGLTRIPPGIHCSATTDTRAELNELEQLQVNHFLQTLAEIALAVASRQASLAGGKLD